MIEYSFDVSDLTAEDVEGFFEGWPVHPSPPVTLSILRGSSHAVVASHGTKVVGFATALSDGILSSYISLLEVLPTYRKQGIGTELIRRITSALGQLYMIDIVCDPPLLPFYGRLGFGAATAAVIRNYSRQGGATIDPSR